MSLQVNVTIPDDRWEAIGTPDPDDGLDGRERLLAEIVVNGMPMHLEAWEIADPGPLNFQEAKVDDESLASIGAALGQSGPFDTLPIGGREYVLIASPHG